MSVDKYRIVIGCEIHCQLTTKTKAFCACENRYGGMPDTRVCPVCLGLPGAMPRVSKGYVELGAIAGTAVAMYFSTRMLPEIATTQEVRTSETVESELNVDAFIEISSLEFTTFTWYSPSPDNSIMFPSTFT